MSTMENNNDNLFRESLGSYREMPSGKVWAGVAGALDKDKKKRRFIIWWWTGGIGFAAAALLLGVIFLNLRSENNTPLTASKGSTPSQSSSVAQTEKTKKKTEKNSTTAPQKNVENTNTTSKKSTEKHKPTTPSKTYAFIAKNKIDNNNIQVQSEIPLGRVIISNTPSSPPPVLPDLPLSGTELTANNMEPTLIEPIALTPGFTYLPPLLFTPIFSVQGNSGAVAYHRKEINATSNGTTNESYTTYQTKAKPFGWYNAVSVKGGFMFKNQLYITAGIGYEHQRFSSRETFFVPAYTGSAPPPTNGTLDINTPTGNGFLPVGMEDMLSSGESINGKLIYQNHHLFFPIDIGYKFSYKRLGVNIGVSSAFHVPLRQEAIFYSDGGDIRTVNMSKQSAFNFSMAFEPMLEYRVARIMGITAGGTFRYSMLNEFKNTQSFSRPYVLAGNLGLRIYLR